MAIRKHAIYRLMSQPPPDAADGACFVSGSGGAGVDTGALIYERGTLFLGTNVIKELAEVAGFSVNAEGLQLEIDNAHLTRQLEAMTAERDQLAEDLDTFAKVLGRSRREP